MNRVDRAIPSLRRWKRGKLIESEGWVGQEVRYKGVIENGLSLMEEEKVEEGLTVRSDWELDMCLFTDSGLIESIISGVPIIDPVLDGSSSGKISKTVEISKADQVLIDDLVKRIEGMYDKLESLRGQESSMGFMKQKQGEKTKLVFGSRRKTRVTNSNSSLRI